MYCSLPGEGEMCIFDFPYFLLAMYVHNDLFDHREVNEIAVLVNYVPCELVRVD